MRRYIIFGSPNDYYRASYNDIVGVEGAIYQHEYLPGRPTLIKKLHTAHCLTDFAVKKKLPLKKIWYKQYFTEKYVEGDEYVFVFFYSWRRIFENGYVEYLRGAYPNCKCALFLCDLACAKMLDIEAQKKRFDHVMVFERNFAKEKQIEYYPLVYSDYSHEINYGEKDIDLLFVGWAKGRYKLLKSIYDRLSAAGVNCQFYMTKMDESVPEEKGIYIRDWVAYPEYKALLKRAKCLLDIIPPNTDCNTLRASEAMSHKCRILTNNSRIVYEEYYNQESISVYGDPDEIDVDFLLKQYKDPGYDEYIPKMGPKAFIQHLDNVFYKKGE